jgi:hypothetical protein
MASQPFGAAGSQALPAFGSTGVSGAAGGAASGAAAPAGGMVASTAAELIPALGQAYALFSLAKMGIQSGTFNSLVHPGTNMPTDYQRAVYNNAVELGKDQPGSPLTSGDDYSFKGPDGKSYDWNTQRLNGKLVNPFQITKLVKGKTLGEKAGNPVWLNPVSGQIESDTYHPAPQGQQMQQPYAAPQASQYVPQPGQGMPADLSNIRNAFQADVNRWQPGLLAQQQGGLLAGPQPQPQQVAPQLAQQIAPQMDPSKGGSQAGIADYKRQMQMQNHAIPSWMLINGRTQ